jgi:predicted phage baseplate assembly protein
MLPAPNLDDRRFQDLVDDARRMVQQRCPGWNDHNVSDPGITLLETFAMMVDQLIYRLNRVPERNYVKFLELIGVQMRPPTAARGRATFWLSAPQPQAVLVRAETEVATPRTDIADPIVFSTIEDLNIVPCSLSHAAAAPADGVLKEFTDSLGGAGFPCFQASPVVGDALMIGLSNAVPAGAVVLRLDCRVSGVGVDPRNPPLAWEAWNGTIWSACDVDRDETGGLNKPGDVVVHLPETHAESTIGGVHAGWVRCRLIAVEPGQRSYTAPPQVTNVSAFTMGATTRIVHAEAVHDEEIGISDGAPGQRFELQRRPVVPWEEPASLKVMDPDGVDIWTPVDQFAEAGADDRVFVVDPVAGEVRFGPAVRVADGSIQHFGAVPAKGAHLRLSVYRTGGGDRGNVAAGQIRVIKTSLPYVARVENRTPAVGGAQAESVQDAKLRGPLVLRSRGRAVTAEDFVELTREAAPEIARVHCITDDVTPGSVGVRVLVIPHVATDAVGRMRREDLAPLPESMERIARYLDERRLVGTRVVIEPPDYQWLTAVVSVKARLGHRADTVRSDVLRALYGLFDPVTGGPDGSGWPFGRTVQSVEVASALARVPGVDMADEVSVRLFPADSANGKRGSEVARLALQPNALVYSYEHQVRVR